MSSKGTPATGTVTIQRRKSGGQWRDWKSATLNGAGKYSLGVKMAKKGTWFYRTMMAGDPDADSSPWQSKGGPRRVHAGGAASPRATLLARATALLPGCRA